MQLSSEAIWQLVLRLIKVLIVLLSWGNSSKFGRILNTV